MRRSLQHLAPAVATLARLGAGVALASLTALAPVHAQQRTTSRTPAPGAKPASAKPASAKPASAKPASARAASKPAARPAAVKAAPVAAAAPAVAGEPLPPDAHRAVRRIRLATAPDGRALGTLDSGTIVTPLARADGWVRVRVEAWVPQQALLPADSAAVGAQLSAADLRADPDGTRGRVVHWPVEVLAFQTADALRRELVVDEPYLLVRGPGDENAILYLALPPSLVAEARELAPLTRILATARVRNGRSAPVGVPVLDLTSFTPIRRR